MSQHLSKNNASKTEQTLIFKKTSIFKFKNRSTRKRTAKSVSAATSYLLQTGICPPIICDENNNILIGELWLAAAREAKISEIPCLQVKSLTHAQKLATEIGYNRILELEGWDEDALKDAVQQIYEFNTDFDFSSIGIEGPELDFHLFSDHSLTPEDEIIVPQNEDIAVSQLGDEWLLGQNILLNGSATESDSYKKLIGNHIIRMIFTDPPYNVPTKGHIGGAGKTKHREFVQASGEMSVAEFTKFLTDFIKHSKNYLIDGAVIYICMDFRHMREVLDSAQTANLALLNLCVWCKNNGGMGSYYRSQHELVFVFRKGTTSHINNIELGKNGRYRTNVWNYAGVNTFKSDRMNELSMHPTVKPTAMVADAILDSSRRGEYILDPFAGSGTIFIACEKTGRKGFGIELDPLYVDVAIRRWEKYSGKEAVHKDSGESFKAREARTTTSKSLNPPTPRIRERAQRKGGQNV